MVVKGEHQFEVSTQELWNYLMDIDVLAKITPGVSKLEVIAEDKYKTVSEIKIGPVKGSFKGDLEVVEKVEPDSFAIVMEQLSKIGNAHVKVDMKINQSGAAGSTLIFDGKAKLSGVIARTGQRVLSGVANKITKEVFASLDEHIAADQKSKGGASEAVTQVEKTKVAEPTTEQGATEKAEAKKVEVESKDKAQEEVSSAETQVSKVVEKEEGAKTKAKVSATHEVEASEGPPFQGRLEGFEKTEAKSIENKGGSENSEVNVEESAGRTKESQSSSTESLESSEASSNNSSSFFASIINFFKRLYS